MTDRPASSVAADLVDRAIDRFEERFGASPTLGALAPGRVNLIGEHTDYNDGLVLPIAIDRHVVALARPSASERSTLWAMDLGADDVATVRLGGALAPVPQRFASFVLGVVDELARRGRPVPELDLALAGTIPVGAGLSSSAALEVAVATMLEPLGPPLDPLERAMLCQAAEHRFGGTPCGIMDMLVSVAARPGQALLIDCRSLALRHVPLPDDGRLAILVADTGVKHELATSAYAQRRATCEAAAARLGRASLRDAGEGDLDDARLDPEQRRRVRHVVEENARTIACATALERGELDVVGRHLLAGHASLRDLYEVSCPEADAIVDAAAGLVGAGVHGARMTGGGFGGSVVILAQPNAVDRVQEHVGRRFEREFGRRPEVFRVRAVGGARGIEGRRGRR